ncbi:hypothetical protein [Trinickia symbiotica]|uniref:hypothetical protein n=1 Tax=Trinickia symbiotica TaxID=863227 RepID=UPI0006ACACBB|nr:hypothetical protein [Trinickia symbiotica]
MEYTSQYLSERFKPNGILDLQALKELPAIFASETSWDGTQPPARVGTIIRAAQAGGQVQIEYVFDPDIAPIPNAVLTALASELDIDVKSSIHEFTRNHWSVKDVDLFRVLLKRGNGARQRPKVFALPEVLPDPKLVAAMMPFDAAFAPVHQALVDAASSSGMALTRADDIWLSDHIIQDVVTLLCKASVVICDLTNRNANVFYEMGIAHALPREVMMITQSAHDVPFDVAHIRHIRYLNNSEGLRKLTVDVRARLETLQSSLLSK